MPLSHEMFIFHRLSDLLFGMLHLYQYSCPGRKKILQDTHVTISMKQDLLPRLDVYIML